jgi:tRNA pseudouridine13 synthase
VPFHRRLTPEQHQTLAVLRLPLPGARTPLDAADPLTVELARAVLAEEGLTWEGLKPKGLRRPFFSRGERPALCLPAGLTHHAEPDERHPGRTKLVLTFELGRGSYATLLVKRAAAFSAPDVP